MDFFGNVFANLVANILCAGILAVMGWFITKLFKRHRWWLATIGQRLVVTFVALLALNVFIFSFNFQVYVAISPFAAAWAVNTLILSAVATLIYYRFRRLGILQTFISTHKGIDYSQTLTRPRQSFDFLGVGAHKLTSDKNFEKMISRCAQARRPVRLLLSHPDNPVLAKVNSRTKLKVDEYSSRVRESLAKLANFEQTGFNVQVRFYRNLGESPSHQFRLVFIDERICVLSYTIWDEKEGGSNPQILLSSDSPSESARSLYAAFKDHYESIWDDAGTEKVVLKDYARPH